VLDLPPSEETAAMPAQIMPLVSRRTAEPFEALRDRADEVLKTNGTRPSVQLVTLGVLAEHGTRLAFMQNLFAAGGLETDVLQGDDWAVGGLPAAFLQQARDHGQRLVCLIGSDGAYGEQAAGLAQCLAAPGRTVWLAGNPGDSKTALTQAGISRFVCGLRRGGGADGCVVSA
jgi:methylmalonyl-CoA mutase